MAERWKVGEIEVEVTHPERILFPEGGITKGDLAAYYRDVAAVMLPHVKGRPLHMDRYPRGIGEPGFVQKEAPENAPHWIERVTVAKEGGEVTHVVCENAATLVYLANLACVTPHVWQSRVPAVERPDRLILDLDPPSDDFGHVRDAARLLRPILEERRLLSFLMTTGSRGMHVVVPIKPVHDFNTVRNVSQSVADELVRRDPTRLTMEMRKEDRAGRLFVDTLRNSYGATAVAPYAVRARSGAPVAAPLTWDELDDPGLTARRFTLRTMAARLETAGDVWKGLEAVAVSLDAAAQALQSHRT
jgi:bifunctional non-homologous end joining protein LigD